MFVLSSLEGTIPLPWLWFLLAIIFAIVEAWTLGVISIWFAIGALVVMVSSIFVDSLIFQVLVFLIVSFILIASARKFAVGILKIGKEKTNIDELIGREAVVVKKLSRMYLER